MISLSEIFESESVAGHWQTIRKIHQYTPDPAATLIAIFYNY